MEQVSSLPALRVSLGWWGGVGVMSLESSEGLKVLVSVSSPVPCVERWGRLRLSMCSPRRLALQQAVLAWAVIAKPAPPSFRDHP